ncbi:MAG: hypothetical protein JXB25_01555 [Deltaproteobacteria bacterium]|nr:hypothetical protein [Deltaproteobacteria bacterium]
MKKTCRWQQNLVLHFLIVAFVWVGLPGIVFAAPVEKTTSAKTSQITTPKASQNLQNLNSAKPQPKIPKPKPAGKILSLNLDTEPNGDWSYLFQIKNTGLIDLNLRTARLKAFQILADNREVLIHEVNYEKVLAPGKIATGREPMHHCFNARKFRLEWWYQGVKLDSKALQVPALKAKIVKAQINKKNNTWLAEIKNLTPLALKVAARPIAKGGIAPKVGQPIGTEAQQVIPASGQAKFMGSLTASDWKGTAEVLARYGNPTLCGGPAESILDTMEIGDDNLGIPDVFIQNVSWNRATMTWVATVKNSTAAPVSVGISGWPLENGAPGMTIWANTEIAPNGTAQLVGNYSSFTVPPGTRLKVHVLLKPSNNKVHEKIIVLD